MREAEVSQASASLLREALRLRTTHPSYAMLNHDVQKYEALLVSMLTRDVRTSPALQVYRRMHGSPSASFVLVLYRGAFTVLVGHICGICFMKIIESRIPSRV